MGSSARVRDFIVVVPSPFHLNGVTEWLSADRSQEIVWNVTTNNDVVYHSVKLQNPEVFNEISSQAEWGTLHIAMMSVSGDDWPHISLLIVRNLEREPHIQDL